MTHLDRLLADHAVNRIRMQHAVVPQKPFFAYCWAAVAETSSEPGTSPPSRSR